jgi:hypothetical protein
MHFGRVMVLILWRSFVKLPFSSMATAGLVVFGQIARVIMPMCGYPVEPLAWWARLIEITGTVCVGMSVGMNVPDAIKQLERDGEL